MMGEKSEVQPVLSNCVLYAGDLGRGHLGDKKEPQNSSPKAVMVPVFEGALHLQGDLFSTICKGTDTLTSLVFRAFGVHALEIAQFGHFGGALCFNSVVCETVLFTVVSKAMSF